MNSTKKHMPYSETDWRKIHNPILPNYLNVQLSLRLEQFTGFEKISTSSLDPLDPAIKCTFCKIHSESLVHLLLECHYVHPIWT